VATPDEPKETLAPEIFESDGSNLPDRMAAFAKTDAESAEPVAAATTSVTAPAPIAEEWTEESAPEPWLKNSAAARKALESAAAKIRESGTRANRLQRELEQALIDRGVEESLKRREQQAAPVVEDKPQVDPRIAKLAELRFTDFDAYEQLRDEIESERINARAEEVYETRERAREQRAYYADVNTAGKKAVALVMERHGLDEKTAGAALVPVLQYYQHYATSDGADLEPWRNPETFLAVAYQLNPLLQSHAAAAATIQVPTVPQNVAAPPTSGKPAAAAPVTKAAPVASEKELAIAGVMGGAAGLSPEAQQRLAAQFARL
jgi:hypothetical protein